MEAFGAMLNPSEAVAVGVEVMVGVEVTVGVFVTVPVSVAVEVGVLLPGARVAVGVGELVLVAVAP